MYRFIILYKIFAVQNTGTRIEKKMHAGIQVKRRSVPSIDLIFFFCGNKGSPCSQHFQIRIHSLPSLYRYLC